jgi:hypothetical protein
MACVAAALQLGRDGIRNQILRRYIASATLAGFLGASICEAQEPAILLLFEFVAIRLVLLALGSSRTAATGIHMAISARLAFFLGIGRQSRSRSGSADRSCKQDGGGQGD